MEVLMKLTAPIFQLKRRARLAARKDGLALNEALNRIAREEGFAKDLLLIAARPGHGKTRVGLRLLIDAIRDGRRSLLFTLEYTEQQARERLNSLAAECGGIADDISIFTSDRISAGYIMEQMSGLEPGAVAVIDYLQLLDQQRSKPALSDQLQTLRAFAGRTRVVLGFISQIDRSFDANGKRLPYLADIRLPNLVDLRLFSKACFLHDGEVALRDVA
jgi:replicative DNA helicase